MKADPFSIGEVLNVPRRFVVPIYQRSYSWTRAGQLERFQATVEEKAIQRIEGAKGFPHYMGALLLNPQGEWAMGKDPLLDVVDGQQRLTTFQLFLAAVMDAARELGDPALADELRAMIFNPATRRMADEKVERYKLVASRYDRALFRDLVEQPSAKIQAIHADAFYKNGRLREDAPLPLAAWWFFREQALKFARAEAGTDALERLRELSSALVEDFRLIVITLDKDDDAQVIFETLNSGGLPLAAMDLVRNDVFHRATRQGEDVEALMDQRWKVFEADFWKESAVQGRLKKQRIDFFLAHTLTAESAKEVLLSELFAQYKVWVRGRFASVDMELASLVLHAPTYRALVLPGSSGPLGELGHLLRVFDVTTAYPLVFMVAASDVSDEEKGSIYRLIGSYVVRRALCGHNPKNYNNTFLRVLAHLRTNGTTATEFRRAFEDAPGDTVRFPTDGEVGTAVKTRAQYGTMPPSRLCFILAQLETASRTAFDPPSGPLDQMWIEHVLPDTWAEHWPLPSGSQAPTDYVVPADDPRHAEIAVRQVLKHSLGNLTLLTSSGNQRLGNLPYTTEDPELKISKREALRTSLFKMNVEIAESESWDEEHIKLRADRLAVSVAKLWPGPAVG
jgi:hypothetical protein